MEAHNVIPPKYLYCGIYITIRNVMQISIRFISIIEMIVLVHLKSESFRPIMYTRGRYAI